MKHFVPPAPQQVSHTGTICAETTAHKGYTRTDSCPSRLFDTKSTLVTCCHNPHTVAASPAVPAGAIVNTPSVLVLSWWVIRRGCSPRGTVRMCSFWISSMLPSMRPSSLQIAKLSGSLGELNDVMKLTCPGRESKPKLVTIPRLPPTCEVQTSVITHKQNFLVL